MANQHTPAHETLRGRILEYVRENPQCTTPELRAEFGIGLDNLGNILGRMQKLGLVTRQKIPGKAPHLWTATDVPPPDVIEENEAAIREARREDDIRRAALPVRRPIVKDWTCTTPRGELETYLFGAAA